jgi:hypothetical protein
MVNEVQVGPKAAQDGAQIVARSTKSGALVVADAHGRFQEAAIRGNLYSGGMTLASISNATFSTGTLGATATPIVGIWNPLSNTKYAVVLQANLQVIITALQVTGPGAFMWCTSTGNSGISTGNNPLNRLTLAATGSAVKDMSGVALTGLTNNLVVRDAASIMGGPATNLSTLQTAAGLMPVAVAGIAHIDGAFIVPPGGVLALLCTTNPPVAISAASSLLWEEVTI